MAHGSDSHPPQSNTGSASSAPSCSKFEAGPSSTPLEGSLHLSDGLSHLSHLDYTNNPTDAPIPTSEPKVAAMSIGNVEALMIRITAEQEVRFQRALEEQARRFEAVIRQHRGGV